MEHLGPEAWAHKAELEEVKRQVGVDHEHFDCWIYKFLENKKFDVDETVAKLRRRRDMEQEHMRHYEVTPQMQDSMREGVMQIIGDDKAGRVTLYVVTRRDFPTSKKREMRRHNADMWMAYACRLRRKDPRCSVTLLVNQRGAGMWANTDLSDQTNVAIRISKFFPNIFERVYVCGMGRALSAAAKPLIRSMPSMISDKVHVLTDGDIEQGSLLEHFDAAVLPVELGGSNDCDNEQSWRHFSDTIEDYFHRLRPALQAGKGVKEWELEQILEEERRDEEQRRKEEAAREMASRLSLAQSAASQDFFTPRGAHASPSVGAMAGAVTDDAADTSSMVTCPSPTCASEICPEGRLLIGAEDAVAAALIECDPLFVALKRLQEQEHFFRENLHKLQEQYTGVYAKRFLDHRPFAPGDDDASIAGAAAPEAERIALRCPAPLRSVTRGVLFALCVMMTGCLLLGTLLAQLAGASIITSLYVGLFQEKPYMLPLGVANLLIFYQSAMVGSRGFELLKSAVHGKLFRQLRPLGRPALVAQYVLFLVIFLVSLFFFFANLSTDDPVLGIRYGTAVGTIACCFLAVIAHLGFPIVGVDPARRDTVPAVGLNLYLFLNITEDTSADFTQPRSAMAVCGVPAVVAFISGVVCMTSFHVVSAAVTLCSTFAAGFACNHFITGDHTNINGNLLRLTAWLVAMAWTFAVLIVARFGFAAEWGAPLGVLCAVATVFSLLTGMCYGFTIGSVQHRYTFRAAYGAYLALLVAAVVMMFTIHWGFGVFGLIMILHSSVAYMRPVPVTTVGLMSQTLCTMLVLLVLLLDSYSAATNTFSGPGTARVEYVAPAEPYPICHQRWAGSRPAAPRMGPRTPVHALSASDLAALIRISYNKNAAARTADLTALFPSMAHVAAFRPSVGFLAVNTFRCRTTNVTAVVIYPRSDEGSVASGAAMWLEAMALAPYVPLTPANLTASTISAVSFANGFFPLDSDKVLSEVSDHVAATAAQVPGRTVLTGHSLGGGVASIVAARRAIPAVTFAAPGLLLSRHKFDVAEHRYQSLVTSIVGDPIGLAALDDFGATEHHLTCRGGGHSAQCHRIPDLLCDLIRRCGTVAARSQTDCPVV